MQGLMMDAALSITQIMRHAERIAGDTEVVSRLHDGRIHRYSYSAAFGRARRLANLLDHLNVPAGARVGTLAWNDFRHFELHYALPCSGRICHTINPKLFPEQISFIIRDAADDVVFIDPQFIALLEPLQAQLPSVRHWIALCDADELPASTLPNLASYEQLLSHQPADYDWPELDENTASNLCYTSGTTGNPKGVLGSHRSIVLHGMAQNMASAVGLVPEDVVMPLVPMFHVNAWGMPYNAPMAGAKLVLPGPHVADARAMIELINAEGVTFSLAVPTLWSGLCSELDQGGAVPTLQRGVIGGAAAPARLYQDMDRHGVTLENGWGMTELSPMGSYNRMRPAHRDLPPEKLAAQRLKSGQPLFGMQMRSVDEDGNCLPRDGHSTGVLEVRAPWACSSYFGADTSHAWFSTGDVATLDEQGYMQVTDRVKDVIKSGGEWISSIEIENAILSHPDVREAAVIGITHPHWSERPLLVITTEAGREPPTTEALIAFLEGKVPKWWLPNASVTLPAMPLTATGKISKKLLREQFVNFQWPAS